MSLNPTLEHTRQVKKIADDLSLLTKEMLNNNMDRQDYQYSNARV